jgi:hypothetical protein
MARGWESKAIETQQEDAERARALRRRSPNVDERAEAAARRTLELERAKAQGDMERATSPAHREMLRRALEDLDGRLRSRGTG